MPEEKRHATRISIDGKPATAATLVQILTALRTDKNPSIKITTDARSLASVVRACYCVSQHQGVRPLTFEQPGKLRSSVRGRDQFEDAVITIDDDFPARGCDTETLEYICLDKPLRFLALRIQQYSQEIS